MISQDVLRLPHIDCCDALTKDEFLTRYGKPNRPFLLKNGMNHTQAMHAWTWEYFKSHYGDREIIVYRTGNRNDYKRLRFAEYIDYIHQTTETHPYYLLDWFVEPNCPEAKQYYAVPEYFDSWTRNFIRPLRPKFLAFYIGPKNSASPLHVDIMSTSAWNAVFSGKKLWVFYPPKQARLVYHGQVDPFQPDHEKFPLFKQAEGCHCLQNAADVVFTPSGWWHAVINTEAVISLTDNFINGSNIGRFITCFFPAVAHLVKRTWQRRKQVYNR